MTNTQSQRPDRRTAEGTTAGVIDTISDAVTFVIQRPWLMVVPLVVDLILWLLLKVTLGPIIENLIRLMETDGVSFEKAFELAQKTFGGVKRWTRKPGKSGKLS